MKETRFFICEHCGNIVGLINNAGVPLKCCGQNMTELVPGTTEARDEKHLPVISVKDNLVTATIGKVLHPANEDHRIQWVYLSTDKGGQRKNLLPGEESEVTFAVYDEKPLAVYAYCNLHGLWKTEI